MRIGRLYGNGITTLADNNSPNLDFSEAVFEKAMRILNSRGKISPDLLDTKEVQALVKEYARLFGLAIAPALESGAIPHVMIEHLRNDVFVFSGFKTYQELREAAALLLDEKGQIKPFHRFYNDITAIKQDYNRNWLQAEYVFAQASAEMAAKWMDFEADGDRYNLQYRTANDNRVRPEHKVLHGITLPASDPFWDEFFPPNGWRCRCTVVQVRKGKYPESDSGTAIQQGREATYQAGKNGVNKAAIFRYNPGKQQVIFPPHHPYYEMSESLRNKLMNKIKQVSSPDIKNGQGLVKRLNAIAGEDWFIRPLQKVLAEKNPHNNGSTDMNGTIWLNKAILKDCIDATNNLKNGKENTFNQERSMATLWHEITHNRNKLGITRMTPRQVRYMETANEFVARNTLPEFFNALGGKLVHKELMENRNNTGYNNWVLAYQKIIEDYGLDKEKVLSVVREHLFNEPYTEQKEGLVKALVVNSGGRISQKMAINLVTQIF